MWHMVEENRKEGNEMTDVNEAFRTERLDLIQSLRDGQADMLTRARDYNAKIDQRIADGKLVPIGNDQYKVDDPNSWDNNEVWTYRKMSVNAPALLLPQHGLDETTGSVALYTHTPAWHDAGNVIPGGTSDIDTVLKLGGIDWDVLQYPTRFLRDGIMESVPGSFINVRNDTQAPIGVVGSKYTPFQNRDAFSFLTELAGTSEVTFTSAGALREGRKVFVSMKFPETLHIDAGGIDYPMEQYIAFLNSHDGSSPVTCVVTPWCPVCGNTERFAVRDAVTSWKVRHTANAPSRVQEAMRSLGLSRKYYEKFAAEEEQLARNEMLLDEFRDLMRDIYPREDDETKAVVTRRNNREDALLAIYGATKEKAGKTAFTAERTFTDYLDHSRTRRGDGGKTALEALAVMEGTDDDVKSKVHKKLMLRVK